jgi:hypothetical protein
VGPGCQARRGRAQLGHLGRGGEGGEKAGVGVVWARSGPAEGGFLFLFLFSISLFHFLFLFLFISFSFESTIC